MSEYDGKHAELDEVLAKALEATRYRSSVDGRVRRFKDHHRLALHDSLRRHLAAWLAAKGAEAELLRRALDGIKEDAEHYCDAGETGYLEGFAATAWEGARAALARPRPSASGLLGLLSELRQDGAGNQPYRRYARVMARRLAAELGLEEDDG